MNRSLKTIVLANIAPIRSISIELQFEQHGYGYNAVTVKYVVNQAKESKLRSVRSWPAHFHPLCARFVAKSADLARKRDREIIKRLRFSRFATFVMNIRARGRESVNSANVTKYRGVEAVSCLPVRKIVQPLYFRSA